MSTYRKCRVRDGNFVEPCQTLEDATAGGNGYRGQGIVRQDLTHLPTGTPSRTFFAVRSGKHRERGIVLNLCPFCGERIDGPVSETDPDDKARWDHENGRGVNV